MSEHSVKFMCFVYCAAINFNYLQTVVRASSSATMATVSATLRCVTGYSTATKARTRSIAVWLCVCFVLINVL